MEEQLIIKSIKDSVPWDQLPRRVRLHLGTNEEYLRRIKEYCMQRRLVWSESPCRAIIREADYYDELIKYSRKVQAPFPYHLADYICRVLRVSPFRYYIDLLFDVMKQEKSYDTIPNFTAADALRETGVGRNEFINIMNRARATLMWRINRGIVRDMLPTSHARFPILPWWLVCLVNLSGEEYRRLSDEEMEVIEKSGGEAECLAGGFEAELLHEMYARGLVYFDVPVYPTDRFRVSSLEGFVSNRNQQSEDAAEKLLYAVFVTSSEQATVEETAVTLQADLVQLAAAMSLACRLGWAEKVFDLAALLEQMNMGQIMPPTGTLASPSGRLVPSWDTSRGSGGAEGAGAGGAAGVDYSSDRLRIAFMVDANLTSFLMMGSFSYELKQQAVTLFEAGKLTDRSVAELCGELRAVEKTRLEGELQKFTDNAFSLRYALHCLRTGTLDVTSSMQGRAGGGKVRRMKAKEGPRRTAAGGREGRARRAAPESSLEAAAARIAGVGGGAEAEGSGAAREDSAEEPRDGREVSHRQLADATAVQAEGGAAAEPATAGGQAADERTQTRQEQEAETLPAQEPPPSSEAGAAVSQPGEPSPGAARSPPPPSLAVLNRVDLLRVESLAGLPAATLQRLMQRDYDLIVSLIPLPRPRLPFVGEASPFDPSVSVTTPGRRLPTLFGSEAAMQAHGVGSGRVPVHFGPPSSLFASPWAKLFLYTRTGAGPVTFVLMRGLRLRTLPSLLASCAKALVWSWDGQGFGGVGGSFEGTLLDGGILLHALNSLLRRCALMVQPLSKPGGWGGGQLAKRQKLPANTGYLDKEGQADVVSYGLPLNTDLSARENEFRPWLLLPPTTTGSLAGIHEDEGGNPDDILEPEGGWQQHQQQPQQQPQQGEADRGESEARQGGAPGGRRPPALCTSALAAEGGEQQQGSRSASEAAVVAAEAMGLDMVGFVRVMRVHAGQAAADREEEEEGGRRMRRRLWVPHSVELGLPLFDTQLCSQVCESIVGRRMLQQPQLAAQQRAFRSLRQKLRDFVSDFGQRGAVAVALQTRNRELLKSTSLKWTPAVPTTPSAAFHDVPLSPLARFGESASVAGLLQPALDVTAGVVGSLGAALSLGGEGSAALGGSGRGLVSSRQLLGESFTEKEAPPTLASMLSVSASVSGAPPPAAKPQSAEEEAEEADHVPLPGANMLFDGALLLPVELGPFLQGRAPAALAQAW